MLAFIAAILTIAGTAIGGLVADRRGVAVAIVPQYLGIALLLVGARVGIAGVVVAVVGVVNATLLWSGTSFAWRLNLNAERRGFDLSVTTLAIIGAIELAINHPFIGQPAVDVAIDVLVIGGLVSGLVGRGIRLVAGLNALLLGGFSLLALANPELSRGVIFLYAALQVSIGLAFDRLWSVEPRDAAESNP